MKNFYTKPAGAILIIIGVFIAGIYEITHLPIALYPQASKPTVNAYLNTRGTNGLEFSKRYGSDIEESLLAIKGVEDVIGRYRSGNARYEIVFPWGVDYDEAEADVKLALAPYEKEFPDHWRDFYTYNSGQHGSMIYATLRNNSNRTLDLYEIAEKSIEPRLRGITGIKNVWVQRPYYESIYVKLIPDQLFGAGVTFADVRGALKKREYDETIGTIEVEGNESLKVTAKHTFNSLQDIKDTVLTSSTGKQLKLSDVAEVFIERKPRDRLYTNNGQKLLMIQGVVDPNANIQKAATDFIDTLKLGATAVDPGLKAEILLNPAAYINDAILNVFLAVGVGMLIATLIVFLFLRSLSSTLIICISIPLSLLGGFMLMDVFAIEVNLISLGAMALAVGMVVDGSVVILENIVRRFEISKPTTLAEKSTTLMQAVSEVRMPIIASLITTIIVFAPLPFTSPLASAILGDLAIVMVCVLIISIFVTILFIPPLILLFSRTPSSPQKINWFQRGFECTQRSYIKMLDTFLSNRKFSIGGFAAILAMLAISTTLMLWKVPRKIMSQPNAGLILWNIDIEDKTMSLMDQSTIITNLEKSLNENFGGLIARTMSETRQDSRSTIWIFVKDKANAESLRHKINGHYRDSALLSYRASMWTPTSLDLPSPPDLKLIVSTNDHEERRDILERINEHAKSMKEFGWRRAHPRDRKDSFINLTYDQRRLQEHKKNGAKLTSDKINAALRGALSEQSLFKVQLDGLDYQLKMGLPEDYVKSLRHVGNFLVNDGASVLPLRNYAKIAHQREWSEYYTERGDSAGFFEAELNADSLLDRKEAESRLLEIIDDDPKIDINKVQPVDPKVEINENLNSILSALTLALMLILIVITLQFHSIKQTLLIMTAIPLGFIGVGFSLYCFSSELNVNSMLGLILLSGTAVNNSILFVDFFNRNRSQSASTKEALLATANQRLRPILVTTLTTILGMLPIAIGWGSGGEILQPLGIAICGGLWISTVLTLFVVPMGLKLFDRPQNILQ